MSDDYLIDPTGQPDPEIARLEETLGAAAYRDELDWERANAYADEQRRLDARGRRRLYGALAVLGVAAAAIALLVIRAGDFGGLLPPEPTLAACPQANDSGPWRVDVVAGAPACGGVPLRSPATLPPGAWLETGANGRATLAVADVGTMDISPDTRLRLTATGPDEHRLELPKGRIHASVDAPPRLFVVTTPTATAVDLGCEYDLEVGDDGGASITVTDGSVSLEGGGRDVEVPAGFRAKTLPGFGPTPAVSSESSDAYFDAVVRQAIEPSAAGLATVLTDSRERDTISLVGLLTLASADACPALHARLRELSPVSFPWDQTDLGCTDVPTLAASWHNLLRQTW